MHFEWEPLLRLLAAAACGGAVGWERQWRRKPAGLRTYMLVTIGAAAFTIGAVRLARGDTSAAASLTDTTRVIQGIVGGIGFLGAGAVFREGNTIEGLTTAAGIWVMGAVGVACGLAYYDLALATTVLTLVVVAALGFVEPKELPPGSK